MTTIIDIQDIMIAHLMHTARQAAETDERLLTMHQETEDLFIISSMEAHHTLHVCTATQSHVLAAIEQWAEETLKWWEEDFPVEHLGSARAVADQRWEDVTFDEQTADRVLGFARDLSVLPDDEFWAAVTRYLNVVRTTADAPALIRLTRDTFPDEQPSNPSQAFFPGTGGHEQLINALSDAGWSFTYIDGSYHYTATAPNGTTVAYIEGDLELESAENRAETITLSVDAGLWRMLDAYVANREALAEADATGGETESLSETTDDLANSIAAVVLNTAAEHE